MARKLRKFKLNNRLALIALGAVVVVTGLGWALTHRSSNQVVPASHPAATTPSTGSSSQSSSTKQSSPAGGFASTPSSTSSTNKSNTATSGTLLTPSGNFISNHMPGRNGSPTQEQSVCNTTPGASCYIKFTKGNDTRTLDAAVADSSGAVIWNWDAANFPAGTWQITAVASLNGQTASATDAINLEVGS